MDPRFKGRFTYAGAWERLKKAAVASASATEQVFYPHPCLLCVLLYYRFYDEVLLFMCKIVPTASNGGPPGGHRGRRIR